MKKNLLLAGMIGLAFGAMSQTTVISEDFEGLSALPTNWTQVTAATDGGWLAGTAGSLSSANWAVSASNATGMLVTNDDGCNCDKANDFLMTPSFDLSTVASAHMSIDVFFNGGTYQGNSESASIEISTDGGTSWTLLETLAGAADWSSYIYDLTSYVGNNNVMIGFRFNDGGGWLFGMGVDNFSVYEPVDRDLSVTSVVIPGYIDINQGAVSISGGIFNLGAAAVTSMDLYYQVGAGGTPVMESLQNLNIAPLTDYPFTHSTSWTPAATGDVEIFVWADNINGMADQNTANDQNSATALVYDQAVPRLPLVESFTSSTCPPCVQGNINMAGLFNAFPDKQNVLKYQMSWPGSGDPYYTDEGGDRRGYYGINSVPNVWVDAGLGINSQSLTQANIDDAAAVPSFVEIIATHTQDDKDFSIEITLNPLVDFAGSNVLMAAIYENETDQNVGTNGETTFDYVMKKMLPDANGSAIGPLTAGTPYTTTLTYTFNGDFRLPANASSPISHATEHSVEGWDDLSVIVWVENQANMEIFQSAISTQVDENGNPVGIEDINNGAIVSMFPNPSNDQTTVWYNVENTADVRLEVYNTIGELVQSTAMGTQTTGQYNTEIGTEELPAGIYFVKLHLGNQTLVEKLMVNH